MQEGWRLHWLLDWLLMQWLLMQWLLMQWLLHLRGRLLRRKMHRWLLHGKRLSRFVLTLGILLHLRRRMLLLLLLLLPAYPQSMKSWVPPRREAQWDGSDGKPQWQGVS